MHRVYVAGSTKAVDEARAVMWVCQSEGWRITFDWTGPNGDIRVDWRDAPESAGALAKTELAAVASADALVLSCPPVGHGTGCFIEVGAALARGMPVAIWGRKKDSVFYYAPGVYVPEDETDLRAWLRRLA